MTVDKKRRGCGGCGLVIFIGLLVLVAWAAIVPFHLLERIGLRESPAERMLAGPPDREAANELLAGLREKGANTQGVRMYVMDLGGTGERVAFAVLDASKGFREEEQLGSDLIVGFIEEMAQAGAERLGIDRLAVQYVDEDGTSVFTVTAPTKLLQAGADGELSPEEFLEAINVDFDIAGILQGAQR